MSTLWERKQLYASKSDNLDETDSFLKDINYHILLKKINKLNIPIPVHEIEHAVKNLSTKKIPSPDGSTDLLY